MKIRIETRENLDVLKYDSCVHYAGSGHVSGYSWYLDNTAESWLALVEGDYESVMPVPVKTRLGRKTAVNPDWVPQLGPYSVHVLSKPRMEALYAVLSKAVDQYSIVLSDIPHKPEAGSDMRVDEKSRFVLPLMQPYESIARGYSENFKKKVEVTYGGHLRIINALKPEKIADFYLEHLVRKKDSKGRRNYHSLLRIMYQLLHRGTGFPSGVIDKQGNLLAVGFFVYSHGRIYQLAGGASAEGSRVNALHFLFDMLVRTHADRPNALHLEEQPGIPLDPAFFEGLGAYTKKSVKISGGRLPYYEQVSLFWAEKVNRWVRDINQSQHRS